MLSSSPSLNDGHPVCGDVKTGVTLIEHTIGDKNAASICAGAAAVARVVLIQWEGFAYCNGSIHARRNISVWPPHNILEIRRSLT